MHALAFDLDKTLSVPIITLGLKWDIGRVNYKYYTGKCLGSAWDKWPVLDILNHLTMEYLKTME